MVFFQLAMVDDTKGRQNNQFCAVKTSNSVSRAPEDPEA